MRVAKLIVLTLLLGCSLAQLHSQKKEIRMSVNKITPVLLVEEVEPCIHFWVDRLGFTKTIEVPEGNKIGFVSLQKGNVELMYQSFSSVQNDDPNRTDVMRKGPTFLYVEVDNLDETIGALKGAEVVMPERTTFYGAKEIGVKDPGGHIITFAQMGVAPAAH
jgi:uncharacterized glyoxalase superfamily protein PhnB